MTDSTTNSADGQELQFNEAEYSAPTAAGATCAACQRAIPDHYYQVNGAVLCENCSTAVKAQLAADSPLRRFFKATCYGLATAIAGFLIYFGVLKITGYEIGLISILVGYMVGMAVRKGSDGRGGVLFQVIAVCCTYLAIAASYSALVIPESIAQMKDPKAAPAAIENAGNPEPKVDGDQEAKVAEPEPVAKPSELTALGLVIGLAILGIFALATPILVGISSPMSLLIVGFALWEAFRLNRFVELVITGPHNVGPVLDQAASHV